jgi:hypothetical protein
VHSNDAQHTKPHPCQELSALEVVAATHFGLGSSDHFGQPAQPVEKASSVHPPIVNDAHSNDAQHTEPHPCQDLSAHEAVGPHGEGGRWLGGGGCSGGLEMARSVLRIVLHRGGTPALAHKENGRLRLASGSGTDGDKNRGKVHRMSQLVQRRGPDFEHGVGRSPVTVEDGWPLVSDGCHTRF